MSRNPLNLDVGTDKKLTILPAHWLLLDQNRSISSGDIEMAKAFCWAGRAIMILTPFWVY